MPIDNLLTNLFGPLFVQGKGIIGEVHYAPSIISFADATRYMLAMARVAYEISPATEVYAGYRRISFGIKNGPNAVLDSGMHVGIKFAF